MFVGGLLASRARTLCRVAETKDASMASEYEQELEHMIDPNVPDLSVLETLRHSAAHVMADAVKQLWPDAQLGFGPETEQGFYYDIKMDHRLVPDDFTAIEAKMKEIVKGKHKFERVEIEREAAVKYFTEQGEALKVQAIEAIPAGAQLTLYKSGGFTDLCRGPHVEHTGRIKAFKLLSVAGAYWRNDQSEMLQRIYATAFESPKELRAHLKDLEEAKKRDHRKLGKELGLFIFDPIAPASPFFTARDRKSVV